MELRNSRFQKLSKIASFTLDETYFPAIKYFPQVRKILLFKIDTVIYYLTLIDLMMSLFDCFPQGLREIPFSYLSLSEILSLESHYSEIDKIFNQPNFWRNKFRDESSEDLPYDHKSDCEDDQEYYRKEYRFYLKNAIREGFLFEAGQLNLSLVDYRNIITKRNDILEYNTGRYFFSQEKKIPPDLKGEYLPQLHSVIALYLGDRDKFLENRGGFISDLDFRPFSRTMIATLIKTGYVSSWSLFKKMIVGYDTRFSVRKKDIPLIKNILHYFMNESWKDGLKQIVEYLDKLLKIPKISGYIIRQNIEEVREIIIRYL